MSLSFTVPGVPRGKGRPRFVRATGRAYTPEQTRNYETLVRHEASIAMQRERIAAPLDGPVLVRVTAHFSVPPSYSSKRQADALLGVTCPPRPDLDQIMKSVLDGMNGVIFRDDAQVSNLSGVKRYTVGPPRVNVWVEALTVEREVASLSTGSIW